MHAIYILSVWLHILAAITWIGGMSFLVLVVVPWLRRGDGAVASTFLRETGLRFRSVGWICFSILVVTGTYNLWVHGVRFGDFVDPAFLGSSFGSALVLKLGLFAVVLVVSAIHDFLLGPRAVLAIEADPRSAEAQRIRRRASLLGRLNAILAVVIVALAVVLVRGWP